MQTAKESGQFENSVFEIHAIRENTRLIARCPFSVCTIPLNISGTAWNPGFHLYLGVLLMHTYVS